MPLKYQIAIKVIATKAENTKASGLFGIIFVVGILDFTVFAT